MVPDHGVAALPGRRECTRLPTRVLHLGACRGSPPGDVVASGEVVIPGSCRRCGHAPCSLVLDHHCVRIQVIRAKSSGRAARADGGTPTAQTGGRDAADD